MTSEEHDEDMIFNFNITKALTLSYTERKCVYLSRAYKRNTQDLGFDPKAGKPNVVAWLHGSSMKRLCQLIVT